MKQKKLLQLEEEEHRKFHNRLLYIFLVILLFLFGGATFYHLIEKWRYLDALYFSAYTMTTVGYGKLIKKTDAGKIFTIIYAFVGVGTALYGLSVMAAHFVEVREEFWIERLGNIRMKHHTKTFWEKIKEFLHFKSDKLIEGYEKSTRK